MLAFDTDEVVVSIIDVANTLCLHMADVLVLKVQMLDEPAVGDFVFRLLMLLEQVTWEHVEAVYFLHLAMSLDHADLVNLTTESLAFGRDHLLEIT